MRPGLFIQAGLVGHDREESLSLIGKLLPSSIVLVRKDFSDRSDLLELIHSIKRLYKIEKDTRYPYIAVDQEGGNVVRLPFLNYNPSNAFLGNLNNECFTEYVGSRTGYDLNSLGIDWNLAPVLDLSSPYNQVILERSFSYDPLIVAAHGRAFIRGIQSYGVAATGKHFPGHGGVLGDSHLMLPKDGRGFGALKSDMLPFQEAVKERVSSIMISHVLYTSIDEAYPATLSPAIYNMLRKELGFKGLAVTDSLNMKAVSKDFSTEEMAKRASRAGADILECVDIDRAMEMSQYLDIKDEAVFTLADLSNVVYEEAADYVNIKLMKCGGITDALKIVKAAQVFRMPCMMGCMVETKLANTAGLHVALAQPNFAYTDLDGFSSLKEPGVNGGLSFVKGINYPPKESGIGASPLVGF